MKAFLMYRDRDFDLQQRLPWNEPALTQDLELNMLVEAMALGDKFLFDVAKKGLLCSLEDLDTIKYRQNVLRDCLANPDVVRRLYAIAVEAIEGSRKSYFWVTARYPASILRAGVELLELFVGSLKQLRGAAKMHRNKFESEGFTTLFAMLERELDDEYFATIQDHLRRLKFRHGVLVSAELGKGNKGTNYVLRKPKDERLSWFERLFAERPQAYTFY